MAQIDLRVRVAGITFPNPILAASGPHGRNARSMVLMARSGAGGILTKTLSLEPRKGYPHPRIFNPNPFILMNSSGGPNPGLAAFQGEIRSAKKEIEVPLVGSLAARSVEEAVKVGTGLAEAGADMLELNFKVLMEMDHPEERLAKSIREVKNSVPIPVGAKLAADRPLEIPRLAGVAEEAGADFLTMVNTVPALSIDIETFRPRLGNPRGAFYSGPAIKPLAVKCIAETARKSTLPIFGVGGCACAEDAIEMILAGARAVQICTAVMLKGPGIFREILSGLSAYLARKRLATVEELCGKALIHLSAPSLHEEWKK
jgi:dihydroorotate dehydrogenase (NAD+) catalytic subunit